MAKHNTVNLNRKNQQDRDAIDCVDAVKAAERRSGSSAARELILLGYASWLTKARSTEIVE